MYDEIANRPYSGADTTPELASTDSTVLPEQGIPQASPLVMSGHIGNEFSGTGNVSLQRNSAHRFACLEPGCKMDFSREDVAMRHFTSIHTREWEFFCDFPGCKRGSKPFNRKDKLKAHQRQGCPGAKRVPRSGSMAPSEQC
jgi:hypothetical protein